MCFAFVYPYSVDVVEAVPPGAAARPKTSGVAGTCNKNDTIVLVASVSAHLVNARVVKLLFYNALALNALPVPLLRQVIFNTNRQNR